MYQNIPSPNILLNNLIKLLKKMSYIFLFTINQWIHYMLNITIKFYMFHIFSSSDNYMIKRNTCFDMVFKEKIIIDSWLHVSDKDTFLSFRMDVNFIWTVVAVLEKIVYHLFFDYLFTFNIILTNHLLTDFTCKYIQECFPIFLFFYHQKHIIWF